MIICDSVCKGVLGPLEANLINLLTSSITIIGSIMTKQLHPQTTPGKGGGFNQYSHQNAYVYGNTVMQIIEKVSGCVQ
jgi:hypothetical protein